jgi:hypothetical protein
MIPNLGLVHYPIEMKIQINYNMINYDVKRFVTPYKQIHIWLFRKRQPTFFSHELLNETLGLEDTISPTGR